ncbi:MAG TPA: LamG-like jellyroll fold domain-containing protein, partial [Planctomycetota bacterium]|nr:LamG-like jellyroll fold domain-containing protein [Planctomycetota bacterium]
NPVSISCWWKPAASESGYLNETLVGGYWYHWLVSVPGNVPTAYIYNSNQELFTVSSNTTVPAGQWAHVAVVCNTNHSIRIYVDGVLKNTGTWQGSFTRAASTMTLGARGTTYVGGAIDEVMVYNRALSDQEVRNIYLAQSDGNGDPTGQIGPKDTNEGEKLEFQVPAAAPDGAPITYSVPNLPPGASFNGATRVFSWTPSFSQAGRYDVTFTASAAGASETVTVTVHNRPLGDANDDREVNILDLIHIRDRIGQDVASNGNWTSDVNEDGAINLLDLIVARRNFGATVSDTPPSAVTDLAATYDAGQQTVGLSWTAPAAGSSGTVASYDVRYALSLIGSEAAWNDATQLQGTPVPAAAGTGQSMALNANTLPAGTVYFAIRSKDRSGNLSDLSNSPFVQLAAQGPEWSNYQPSGDSRVVYVSRSAGSDSYDGYTPEWNGSSGPKASVAAGIAMMRDGMPDWLLLRRGDTWYEGINLGIAGGRSTSEPMLLSAYGTAPQRPLLKTGTRPGFNAGKRVSNLAIVGLDFYAQTRDPDSPEYSGTAGETGIRIICVGGNVVIEDCVVRFYSDGMVTQAYPEPNRLSNITIRGCIVVDSYATNKHAQGLYANAVDGLVIDRCLFDHNGWSEKAPGGGETIFNHNIYLSGDNSGVVVKDSIIARASSHGLQARSGGDILRNLFLRNSIHLSFGFVNGSSIKPGGVSGTVSDNVFLEDKSIAGSVRGWAMEVSNTRPGAAVSIRNNIIAHSLQQGYPAIILSFGNAVSNQQQAVGINDLTIENNIVYDWKQSLRLVSGLVPGGSGFNALRNLTVRGNAFQHLGTSIIDHQCGYNAGQEHWSGNRYYSSMAPGSWFWLAGAQTAWDAWRSQIDTTGSNAKVTYAQPDRSMAGYSASLGNAKTLEAFLHEARKQSRANWRDQYGAAAAISYIKAGFVAQ